MTEHQSDQPGRRAPARTRWPVITPVVLMVTPAVHLALGAEGGYFWFYVGLLGLLGAYLGAALLRPDRSDRS